MAVVGHTLWVGAVDSGPTTKGPPQISLFGLDPSSLELRGTAPAAGAIQFAAIGDTLWSLKQVPGSRWQLVRHDPATGVADGVVLRPFECQGSPLFNLTDFFTATVDAPAEVLWIICQAEPGPGPGDFTGTAIALDFGTGAERGRVKLPATVSWDGPALGTAADGSLFTMTFERPGEPRFGRLSPAGRQLPAGKIAEVARLEPFSSSLQPRGGRLWLQTSTRSEITCLDRGTGEILANYPVPPRSGADGGLLAGDSHQIYTVGYNKIFVLRGPDRCLS